MYTGMIRPILSYMAEVWSKEGGPDIVGEAKLLSNAVLRRVTRAYRGSSTWEVSWIANVEPL